MTFITNKLPVCIISHNRSYYLESLLHSLSGELTDCDIVICDNGSTESRMLSVLTEWSDRIEILNLPGDDWINDEYKAKNELLNYCLTKYDVTSYLFLQDDMQYVGPRGMLKSIADDLSNTPFLNVGMTGVRNITLENILSNRKIGNVWQLRDNHICTTGLFKKRLFEDVGMYSDQYPTSKEYWGRGEDDYHARTVKKYGIDTSLSGFSHTPVFLGVWNDPRGHYSFLRGGRRYGHYLPAPESMYYEHMTIDEYNQKISLSRPSSFVDIAKPIGWDYAKTVHGDQLKYPQSKIMIEGPVSDII